MLDLIPSQFLTGTAPQWALLIIVVLALAKLVIPWKQQNYATMEGICRNLQSRVDELTKRLDECEDRCQHRDDTILGMKKQSVSNQIGFARLLMKALGQDNPELQHMLTTLEGLEKELDQPILIENSNGSKS